MKKPKPKFRAGQVVRIDTPFYREDHKAEQYQKITKIFSWPKCKASPFGYVFANRDECNEKYIQPLTDKER